MIRILLLFLLFHSKAPAAEACLDSIKSVHLDKKKVGDNFSIVSKNINKMSTLSFVWQKKLKLNKVQHRRLFFKVISALDKTLKKGICKTLYHRFFIIYPTISYSISRSELTKVRRFRKRQKLWESNILLRTQVVPLE